MILNVAPWRSLQARITLFTLIIFLLGIWSLAFYASRMLHADMKRMLGEQQYASLSLIAANVNQEVLNRFRALEIVAGKMTPAVLRNTAALQALLHQQYPVLQSLFNAGTFVTGRDGGATASVPLSAGRAGINYTHSDYIASSLKEGAAAVGRPVMGGKAGAPMFSMSVPIRDAQGQVIGVLAGVTDLSAPSFLDMISENRYGKTGGYLLDSPRHRLVVTATDKRRIMETLPELGVHPMLDRFLLGYEGSEVLVNPLGEEVLVSVKKVPIADWCAVALLPTEEAFAPIRAMEQRMLGAALVLTLLAGGLSWWMLRRQLSPMLGAIKTLAVLSESDQPAQPLPITSYDEIGRLIGGFNRLVQTLERRTAALREREVHLRCLTEMSSDFYWQSDAEHRFTQRTQSKREAAILGFRATLFMGAYRWAVPCLTPDAAGWRAHRALLDAHLPFRDFEISRAGIDGGVHYVAVSGDPVFDAAGQFTGYRGIGSDITVRKQAEAELRIAACAFESHVGMMITDAHRVIQRVNQAFSASTGYTAAEAIGQTPRLLSSGRHDAEFYSKMWECIDQTGTWQGEIWDRRKNGQIFPKWLTITAVKASDGFITHYVGTHTDITERKAAQERIEFLAYHDALTGLPNRRLLMDRLQQTLASSARSGLTGVLFLLDLDNFKSLNDTLGHDSGDLLLQQVGQRLVACVRAGDTVARLGGDEFVVLIENLGQSPEEAATLAETLGAKILATLNQAYQLDAYEYHSTPSIGLTLFNGQQNTGDELLKQADLAMYQAKTAGRNAVRFFDPRMQALVNERALLEIELREAVRQQQFVVHYQAQVVGEGRLTGAEALVRWQHPVRGLVLPNEFIPLAEETKLILPLGAWVLDAACTQLAQWAAQPSTADLTLAVNISASQLHQADFVERVLAVLAKTGANPQRLKLELTESQLVSNVEQSISKMAALKAYGVGFAMDDFGTGYSSLFSLKRLPLDQLKIDQSFVRDILTEPNDAAIAKMIIVLAQSLGLTVIAEGVEIEAQRDFLARQGCHAYQGFLFSEALPGDRFEALTRGVDSRLKPG